jgi:hypothetical protein
MRASDFGLVRLAGPGADPAVQVAEGRTLVRRIISERSRKVYPPSRWITSDLKGAVFRAFEPWRLIVLLVFLAIPIVLVLAVVLLVRRSNRRPPTPQACPAQDYRPPRCPQQGGYPQPPDEPPGGKVHRSPYQESRGAAESQVASGWVP